MAFDAFCLTEVVLSEIPEDYLVRCLWTWKLGICGACSGIVAGTAVGDHCDYGDWADLLCVLWLVAWFTGYNRVQHVLKLMCDASWWHHIVTGLDFDDLWGQSEHALTIELLRW